MVIDRFIGGAGTTEEEWRNCPALQALKTASIEVLVPAGARLVIVAPHPDDEILPCAGLVAAAADRGNAVVILALTDGEGSHQESLTITPAELRRCRPQETEEALRRLGVGADIQRLRLPDGRLAEGESALEREFTRRFHRDDVVITPWRFDGHPDHEAAARAALAAGARCGSALRETPIWGWHWSRPADTPMPWKNGVRFALSAGYLRRKQSAIRAFESQLQPDGNTPAILTEATLARFARPGEVYFR